MYKSRRRMNSALEAPEGASKSLRDCVAEGHVAPILIGDRLIQKQTAPTRYSSPCRKPLIQSSRKPVMIVSASASRPRSMGKGADGVAFTSSSWLR
jgi:hypothetical protein